MFAYTVVGFGSIKLSMLWLARLLVGDLSEGQPVGCVSDGRITATFNVINVHYKLFCMYSVYGFTKVLTIYTITIVINVSSNN